METQAINTEPVHTVQLTIGDYIEAWHNGKLYHQGRVTDVVPKLDLFWILDARTGTRRLLDPEALEIIKVGEPAERAIKARIHPVGTAGETPNGSQVPA